MPDVDDTPDTDDKIDVTVSIQYHDDGQVSLTLGPVDVDDVGAMLASVGTDEFRDGFITALEAALKKKRLEGLKESDA